MISLISKKRRIELDCFYHGYTDSVSELLIRLNARLAWTFWEKF